MSRGKDLIGKVFPTNLYGNVRIIGYESYKRVRVEFDTGDSCYCRMGDLKNGEVRNPYHPNKYGAGFIGEGDYRAATKRGHTLEYRYWTGVMERGHSEAFKAIKPTYKDCYVDSEWHNFQNFARWCNTQKGFGKDGWHLDKDLLVKGNKKYSKDTCVFIPPEINLAISLKKSTRGDLPIGVTYTNGFYRAQWGEFGIQQQSETLKCPYECFLIYKQNKENHLKVLAELWEGEIEDVAVEALINFEVELDD